MASDLTAQLAGLAELQEGWDSYGANPITAEAIARCKAIHFSPCTNGGILIELTDGAHEVELSVEPDGTLSGVIYERTTRAVSTGEDPTTAP